MDRKHIRRQLIEDEGSVPHAYLDSLGYWTIGVGRLIDGDKGGRLREDEIEYLLDNDIDDVVSHIISEYPWFGDLDDVRQGVIVNMTFNLGKLGFSRFKLLHAACARHDWEDAAREMLDSRWATQVGSRAIRLSEEMRTGGNDGNE